MNLISAPAEKEVWQELHLPRYFDFMVRSILSRLVDGCQALVERFTIVSIQAWIEALNGSSTISTRLAILAGDDLELLAQTVEISREIASTSSATVFWSSAVVLIIGSCAGSLEERSALVLSRRSRGSLP